MLTSEKKQFFTQLLINLSDAVSLTDAQYGFANAKFQTVAAFLTLPGSLLAKYLPKVFLQGSMRLGTAIRPLTEEEEFDVDMTLLLLIDQGLVSAKDVKNLVRLRLEQSEDYKRMLDEHRRCWRLPYADAARFHLDVVPAIPANFSFIIDQNVPERFAKHTIGITDNKKESYAIQGAELPKSNTEGLALWFLERMSEDIIIAKTRIFSATGKAISSIPDYQARTALQRIIQLMKAHRDVEFADDKDDKPVSVIIMTLAARAYFQGENLYDSLIGLLDRMPTYITTRFVGGKNVRWVENPVNPLENFADKWQEHPEREIKFFAWFNKFKADIYRLSLLEGLPVIGGEMKSMFGTRAVNDALNMMGTNAFEQRLSGNLKVAAGTGMLGTIGRTIPAHNFHGKKS
ncbi:nucleotidyltransferase [Pedobacter aquatilis]|uniref:nucleotidyltransferase domain-containing protein n=1 Tax=Pedobacter aquatilis TaxID=351343 RepID=UPI00292ECDFD|nr:nucleotidyltransferase [Pedobacter aquatilis]